ncbi:MAG: MerR family transcriptional regulator [Eggerthellaceae bacterium]|nr:MerR family transcriptional regulator [Eggerthellaceae bacterium]
MQYSDFEAPETEQHRDGLVFVTELARRVGVSVRTIQYYDQMGLLAPNAKGPNNQRLYTEEERSQLYRILVLKYLGYSLKEIRAGAGPESIHDIRPFLTDALDKLEPEFLELFRRMSTLRKLATAKTEDSTWDDLAHIIESEEQNGPLFWQAMSIHDEAPQEEQAVAMDPAEVQQWHALCREAMGLMQGGVPPTAPPAKALAERFRALGGAERAREGVKLMITTMGSHGSSMNAVPDSLIDGIIGYLSGADAPVRMPPHIQPPR